MIKKLLITLLVLILLLIVGAVIFLLTFDLNHYREFTQKKLSQTLNYPVHIGSMHTKLSLIPTIKITNFKILQNGENPKIILDVPQMEATIDILPLLKKKIEISKINILLVSLDSTLLSKNEKQNPEKQTLPQERVTDSATLLSQLWVQQITVDKFLYRFMNRDKKEAVELDNFTLTNLNKFKFQIIYKAKKIDVEGSAGLLTKLLTDTRNLPIDLKIKQGNASLSLKGQIGNLSKLSQIRLDAQFSVSKLASFLRLWGISIPKFLDVNTALKFSVGGDLQKLTFKGIDIDVDKKAFVISADGEALNLEKNPSLTLKTNAALNKSGFSEKLNLKPFEVMLNVRANKESASLENITFKAGRSDLAGNILLNWKNTLYVEPKLTSSYLNVKDIVETNQQTGAKNIPINPPSVKNAPFIPNAKVDFDILKKFNLGGKIEISHLFLTDQLTDYLTINISPKLNKGHLTSDFTGVLLSGKIRGNIDMDADKKALTLKFVGQTLDLDKIRDINKTIKGAKVNTEISLSSRGNTIKNLATNSEGQILIELLGGTITDKWFNSLPSAVSKAKQKSGLLDFSTSDQKTDIMCGAINVPVKNGIITSNEKIVLQTDALNFVAKGQINLRNETVNLTIIPSINQTRGMANSLLSTIQAIHLKGPWNNIEPSVDAGRAIGNIAQIAAQKLTGQKTQILGSTDLCQKVLGKKIQRATASKTPQKQVQVTQPKQVTAKKENLKQQLIDSLSQALQNKVKK